MFAITILTGLGTPAFAGNGAIHPECGAMYGSAGNDGTNPGSIFLISQVDGSQTFIGDPTTDGGLSGIAFDDQARLWGSNVFGGADSNLIQINPTDGTLINDVGQIKDASGNGMKVQDLAFDPVSKQLFGTSFDVLLTIDRATGIATSVGALPNEPMHIGFGPGGTLWGVDRNSGGDLFTLDPSNANVLTQVPRSPTGYELDALGVDPSTGIIWVAGTTYEGNGPEVNTIDSAGNRVIVGSGVRVVADLDFLPCPVVVGGEGLSIDSTALILAGAQSATWMIPVILSIIGIGVFVISKKSE